jgi:dipeptidyl aminopeptidase/acylaminoacyl peptidase
MKNLFTKIILFVLFLFLIHPAYSQQKIDGTWSGAILIMGTELGIDIKFKTETDSIRGTIDIPQQNAKDLKLIHISFTSPKVYFELPAGTVAVFDGESQGDSITGKFLQAGMEGKFNLKKTSDDATLVETQPEKTDTIPLPYNSEEVTFSNGDIKFAGTLTTPKTEGKHPAVVMITGSGPQNRDEELVGFKPFKIIADYLTRNGIAVLRYDDRGVGGSTGKNVIEYTTDDFAGDVLEAVKFLKSRSDINPEQIGLMGHSEGGIVAPLAASKSKDIAFIVLMAGTSVEGIDIIKEQSALIMRAANTPEDVIKSNDELLDKLYNVLTSNGDMETLRPELSKEVERSYNDLPEAQKKTITDKKEYIKSMVDMQFKQLGSPWMTYFLTYDPALALEKVTCPVLGLFGELDLQVPPSQSKEPMENALKKGGNKDYKIVVLPKANHLFQSATTGSPSEYAKLPKEFVPEFLDTVKDWIAERVTVVK